MTLFVLTWTTYLLANNEQICKTWNIIEILGQSKNSITNLPENKFNMSI